MSQRDDARSAAKVPDRYLFIWKGGITIIPDNREAVAMYRLACRECGEAFEENETPVRSRSISGGPFVHEECAS